MYLGKKKKTEGRKKGLGRVKGTQNNLEELYQPCRKAKLQGEVRPHGAHQGMAALVGRVARGQKKVSSRGKMSFEGNMWGSTGGRGKTCRSHHGKNFVQSK